MTSTPASSEALALRAALVARGGAHAEAARLLEAALATSDQASPARLHLRLAKLYEHKLKELRLALHHGNLAAPAEGGEASELRSRRLERRIRRVSGKEPTGSSWI